MHQQSNEKEDKALTAEPILQVQGLTKYFDINAGLFQPQKQVHAVENVSFVLNESETLGIVGESGSGKSTLARVILGLLPETSGKVFYREQDITGLHGQKAKKLHQELQMVFQDPYASLNPRLKIGEAIAEPMLVNRVVKDKQDILIKNGWVVDGTGQPGWKGDVLIKADRIVKLAPNIDVEAGVEVIDASGKVVSPGFIDPHVHEEWVCFVDGTYEWFMRQGVTTVVNGNCGHSIVPGPKENIVDYYFGNGLFSLAQRERYKVSFPDWQDFEAYSQAVAQKGSNLNFVTLLGHGTIRWSVMHGAHPRKPDAEEAKAIEQIIRTNMEQGAWGLSFGLDYVPSRYAEMEELVEVSRMIKEYDGVVAAHMRQSIGIEEALAEFIEVGRRSGAKLQASHVSSMHPKAFDMVKAAREEEQIDILVDTIPRSTGHLNSKSRQILFIMALSDDLFAAGPEGVKAALKTPEGRAIIKKDAYIFAGDKSDKFIVMSDDPSIEYMSVAAIAKRRGIDPDDCMLDLLADDNNYVFWLGGPSRADFPKEGHCASIVSNPYVSVGSDEIMGDIADPYDWYELQRRGSFPIFMQMYREKGVPIEEIIRRNTTMVAEHFGIPERGQLKEGYFADVAVIDIERFRFPGPDEIDYRKPLTVAEGVDQLLVNGQFTIKDGQLARPFSGRVLKKR